MTNVEEFNIESHLRDMRCHNRARYRIEIEHYELLLKEITRLRALNEKLAAACEALIDDLVTDSFCPWCEAHAPKNYKGEITGPIHHRADCARLLADVALAEYQQSSPTTVAAGDGDSQVAAVTNADKLNC